MAFNLRNRSFTKLLDFTPKEIKFLLQLSADLKAAKYGGYEQQRLKGKNIALIFELVVATELGLETFLDQLLVNCRNCFFSRSFPVLTSFGSLFFHARFKTFFTIQPP